MMAICALVVACLISCSLVLITFIYKVDEREEELELQQLKNKQHQQHHESDWVICVDDMDEKNQ